MPFVHVIRLPNIKGVYFFHNAWSMKRNESAIFYLGSQYGHILGARNFHTAKLGMVPCTKKPTGKQQGRAAK
jgi:hypothetical protein